MDGVAYWFVQPEGQQGVGVSQAKRCLDQRRSEPSMRPESSYPLPVLALAKLSSTPTHARVYYANIL